MRIRILSDLHLEFADFHPPPAPADVVVLAGDIHVGTHAVAWAREAFPDVPVLYVLGNHEYYQGAIPRVLDQLRDKARGSNVQILEQESTRIGGVRFLGATLWTDMAAVDGDAHVGMAAAAATMSDFRLIRLAPRYRRLRPEDTVVFHHQARRWLERELSAAAGPHVVITHHAPLLQSLHPAYAGERGNAAYASDLHALIDGAGPALWIHGHVHHAHDYQTGRTRIVCNPRGYPREAVEGFRPDLVVEIDGDGALAAGAPDVT